VTVAKYYIPSGRCIQKLDYAHRDSSGKATEVEVAGSASFKTRNGRKVEEGRGIMPDVEVMEPELAKVVGGLFEADLFFDFATRFRAENAEIGPAEDFRITDALYRSFVDFVKDKQFEYDTESMEALAALTEKVKKERYYEHAEDELDALRKELAPDRTEDLERFRSDIEEVLRSEIVARYHFQTGRAKAALSTDPYVKKAIDLFATGGVAPILSGSRN
jgi:carboxyl-terminal processing protease